MTRVPVILAAAAAAITAAGLGLVQASSPRSATFVQTSTPPETTLTNGQLRVRVYLPHPEIGYYRSTRFDWSGIIAGVEYQGHQFYGPWFTTHESGIRDFVYRGDDIVVGDQSAVTGPAEEFSRPQNYLAAKPGETFVKVGVGVLRKKADAPYSAYDTYDVASTGAWEVEERPNVLDMTQRVTDAASGYGYDYRKILRLTPNRPELVIEHTLRNTGRLPIDTPQYNHNFLTLDQQPTGPDFVITVPFAIKTSKPPDPALAEIRGNQIVYTKVLTGQDRVTFSIEGYGQTAKDYDIRVENRRTGAGFRVVGDRPMSQLALWSIRSVISMEPFVDVSTAPGQTTTWRYTYTYFKNQPK